jgi:signal transduction histidine kinase
LLESNHQVRQLTGRLINAQEEERRRVARELHDQVGQTLTLAKFSLDTLRSRNNPADCKALLEEGNGLVSQALGEVRELSMLLRPSMLDDLGLEPALRSLLDSHGRRTGCDVTFRTDGLQTRPPPDVETICYRVAQEGLTNVSRHGKATRVWLDVIVKEGRLRMTLRDDGIGFDVEAMSAGAAQGKSLGLLNMAERASMGRGNLQITSAAGRGTTLTLDVPLQPAVA